MTTNANVSLGITAINSTNAAFRQARNNVVGMNAAVGLMNHSVRRNRLMIQQAGMQISDFSMQVAGGQSAILAFTQQVPQFIQQFGAMGGILAAIITILGTLTLVFVRTGTSMAQITPIMGVLEDQFAALVPLVTAIKEAFIGFANLIVNNLDRIVIAASVIVAYFTGQWLAAFLIAGGAVKLLTGTLALLRWAMMRLPFVILVMAITELIYQFLRLVEGAGGVGEAFALLKDVAIESWDRIAQGFGAIPLAISAGAASMTVIFGDALTRMMANFADFTWTIAEGLNGLFGLNLAGVAFNPMVNPEWFDSLSEARGQAEAATGAYNNAIAGITAPMASLDALRDAVNSVTDTQYDVRDWFGGVADAADGGGGGDGGSGGAAEAVARVADAFKQLKSSISGSIETMFMDIVKGTASVTDAFKKMAADIIAEMFRVMMVQHWVSGIMKAFSSFTGFGPTLGPKIDMPGSIAGARASGGPVTGGKTYLVGERGPELFAPSVSGQIVPNNEMGGGSGDVVIQQHFHISTGVSETVRAEIAAMMPMFRRNAVAAVEDARRRNQIRGT